MTEEPLERRDWTDEELDLIVADYFSMLADELSDVAYSKAGHNRALQDLIPRSASSIEFKHRNISAVLALLGLPIIHGYFPAANYQRAIIPAIDRYLSRTPLALHPEQTTRGFSERSTLFVEAAPQLAPPKQKSGELQRLVRKFNPVERDFRNRRLGRDGEELIFHFEQERLKSFDRPDLARRVRWVSQEDGDGAGYDILSFDSAGNERLLEVKTTVGPSVTPFYITRNELSLSSERPKAFKLCRVYDFSARPRMFELTPPLEDRIRLSPLNYEASFS